MTAPQLLAQLSDLHQMMRGLLAGVPHQDASTRFHPELASVAWLLGRSVFRETYWLREILAGDADLTQRVRPLFLADAADLDERCAALPPPDHLLAWAQEIQDEHLRRLATPGALPDHPLLNDDRLQWFLLQEAARDYELMLAVLLARSLAKASGDHLVGTPLTPRLPTRDLAEVTQGHYRIGSRDEPRAYDNELPPQAVELSNFRIARYPVTNAEFLAFMEDGGYARERLWSSEGLCWLRSNTVGAPWQWRTDAGGQWYEVGLNGPVDLAPGQPVFGISQHEAAAFAAWVSGLGEALGGAVLQHEYQWETAARSGLIEGIGSAWEWCSNSFHPYPEFSPFPDQASTVSDFGASCVSLRGACLHTQRCLRRASFRNWAQPQARQLIAGIRLVFPPG
jgi:iron(II)-dependent oxidoreductase